MICIIANLEIKQSVNNLKFVSLIFLVRCGFCIILFKIYY